MPNLLTPYQIKVLNGWKKGEIKTLAQSGARTVKTLLALMRHGYVESDKGYIELTRGEGHFHAVFRRVR